MSAIDAKELELQTSLGIRDWQAYPPTVEEVKAWRSSMNRATERGMTVSWTIAGWTHIRRMCDAEKRYEALGLL